MHPVKNILVLAPHTDDGEFGCGGTIARLVEEGARVSYIAFSAAEQSVPAHLPKDILRHEAKKATAALGIADQDCHILNFQVRLFPQNRQEILETLVKMGREIQPELVFLPSTFDTHQDHEVIAREGFRALKRASVLGYEIPWNNVGFDANTFYALEEKHVATKIQSLSNYGSQQHRDYADEDFIRSHLRFRGTQIGAKYAEAFQTMRWIHR